MNLDRCSLMILACSLVAGHTYPGNLLAAPPGSCSPWPECKDGGGEEPPPPPSDGSVCAMHPDFPALVYQIETIENEGHGPKEKSTYHVYLANSDRSCSMAIYSGHQSMGERPSYRQIDSVGKVVAVRKEVSSRKQCKPEGIISLNFTVENNAVTTPLPLEWQSVYELPICGYLGVHDPVLAPDGSEIFYFLEELNPDPQIDWLDSINVIDVSNCVSNCVSTRLYEWDERALHRLSMNPAGTRIYMAGHDRIADRYSVSFVERDTAGNWSAVQDVVNSDDPDYATSELGEGSYTAATSWAYDGVPHEVIAFGRDDGTRTSDILDVDDCDVFDTETSCLAAGKASYVPGSGVMIPGVVVGFTNFASDGTNPNMFVVLNGLWSELDLASLNDLGEIVPGANVRGVDSAE